MGSLEGLRLSAGGLGLASKEDVMIILGDAGINFSGGIRDMRKKEFLKSLSITIFAIHGNHEQRPQAVGGYVEKVWRGGISVSGRRVSEFAVCKGRGSV